ncbi:MAG TPA: carbonic anhydrase [Trebonia sp.]|nr:carbonic anhydrase [Trebonia sp.]
MGVTETLTERNAKFAETTFDSSLRMRPKLTTIVICCADTRVDPAVVLGAEPGEIMALRNIGGRVTPGTLDELVMLRRVSQSTGGDMDSEWELIVMQHTQCGITKIQDQHELLAHYFQVGQDRLQDESIADPRAAVARDVAALRAESRLNEGVRVSGLVYDVTTGRVETVVPA